MASWRRAGLVLGPPAAHRWWRSCAGVPTCLPLADDRWRVWFGGRDESGRAGVLRAELDPRDGMRVLSLHEVPGLERGADGAFDSAGLWGSAVVADGDRVLMWYTGMRLGDGVPHELAIGLAISDDGGLTFRKEPAPVLESPPGLPRFVTTPCVRRRGDGYVMWYSRGLAWRENGDRRDPWYDFRIARSADGRDWTTDAEPALTLEGSPWAGLTRPWVDDEDTVWFSARGGSTFRNASADAYRLYRAALNGDRVRPGSVRPVEFVPPPAAGDWDDWMQVSPCVVRDGARRVMFYNGNHFARDGFGWAIEEPEGA